MAENTFIERASGHLLFHQTGECHLFSNPIQYKSTNQKKGFEQ